MDTVKTVLPYAATLLMLGAWFALVVLKIVPPNDFVTMLAAALSGIGTHAVHIGRQSQAANAQPTQPAAQPVKTNAPPAA